MTNPKNVSFSGKFKTGFESWNRRYLGSECSIVHFRGIFPQISVDRRALSVSLACNEWPLIILLRLWVTGGSLNLAFTAKKGWFNKIRLFGGLQTLSTCKEAFSPSAKAHLFDDAQPKLLRKTWKSTKQKRFHSHDLPSWSFLTSGWTFSSVGVLFCLHHTCLLCSQDVFLTLTKRS